MKRLPFLLALVLLLGCLAGCGAGAQPKAAAPTDGSFYADVAPESEILPDFTVQCVDGSSFTLSEALQDHELAVINLFSSGYDPCVAEFPLLQEAWSQVEDRVAVIALSIDPQDTEAVLRDYAAELGVGFPVGREAGTDLARFSVWGFPATLLVDKNRRVAALEVGARESAQEFLDWFDAYLGDNYDPAVCTYTVCCYSSRTFEGVPGVVVNFCTDTVCVPVTTSEMGVAVFVGPPARYHVQIVKEPSTHHLEGDVTEWETEPYAQSFWFSFEETVVTFEEAATHAPK